MDKETMGKFILKRRNSVGLTQKELAEKLFLTANAVSKWERGINYPDVTIFKPLAEALEISLEQLMNCCEHGSEQNLQNSTALENTMEVSKAIIHKKSVASFLRGFVFPALAIICSICIFYGGFNKSVVYAKDYFSEPQKIVSQKHKELMAGISEVTKSSDGEFQEGKVKTSNLCGAEKLQEIQMLSDYNLSISTDRKKGDLRIIVADENNDILLCEENKANSSIRLQKGNYSLYAVGYWFKGEINYKVLS